MKKVFILLLLFVAVSSAAYSQDKTQKVTPSIECQIDSVIKKYDVKNITVSSANGVNINNATDFYFENGFLVVQKTNLFNMQRLVSFQLFKAIFDKRYYMSIIFN